MKKRTKAKSPSKQASRVRVSAPEQLQDPPELPDDAAAPSPLLAKVATDFGAIYLSARSSDEAGRVQLDVQRLTQSLASVGLGSRAEQELYHLALLAAEEGHLALFEDDVISALRRAG